MIITTLCFTQNYRMIGSLFHNFDNASKISGLWCTIMSVAAKYFIPYQSMHPWFRRIFWVNHMGYSYECLLANKFGGLILDCIGDQLVPNDPSSSSNSNRNYTVTSATSDGTAIIGTVCIMRS